MAEFIDLMRVWIEAVITQMGYPGLSLLMFLENAFPPIPSEPIMIFSGSLAASGKMHILGVLFFSTLGSVAGAVLLYFMGLKTSDLLVRALLRRYGAYIFLTEGDLDHSLEQFNRNGPGFILLGRLFPVVRSLISIPAGMSKMVMGKFLGLTLMGTSLWNSALALSGMFLGTQWERVLETIEQYEAVILVIAVPLMLYKAIEILSRWWSRRARAQGDSGG